ncbi:MAG: aspartate dehydrogenase [Chloroflexi bacterium]|nr:aspartate dehydrogenase [Chloroflexota bacterium]
MTNNNNQLNVGFIGTGAICSLIAKEIESGKVGKVHIIAVFDINLSSANNLVDQLKSEPSVYNSIENLVDNPQIDLIIECASPIAVEKNAEIVLKANKDILIMSSGALLDKKFFSRLKNISNKNNKKIYVPSGAVGAIDTIKSLKGIINEVTITTTKNPISLLGSLGFKKWEEKKITEKKLIFTGNANEAIKLFPANVNIAATISLSGIGAENTKVLVYADPNSKSNIHEVSIKSKAGNYKFTFENLPSKENPKTSYLAILSALQTIRKINGNFLEIGS